MPFVEQNLKHLRNALGADPRAHDVGDADRIRLRFVVAAEFREKSRPRHVDAGGRSLAATDIDQNAAKGQPNLRPLLLLKYNAIADAVADLGRPDEIGNVFVGFQKYLYQEAA